MNNTDNVMIAEVPTGDRELLSTLTLTTTTHPDDSGNYTCRAVNIVDDNITSALLNVQCMVLYSLYTSIQNCGLILREDNLMDGIYSVHIVKNLFTDKLTFKL